MSDGAAPERTGWWPDPTGRFDRRFAIRGGWTQRVRVGDAEAIDGRPVAVPTDGPAEAVWRTAPTTDDAGWRDDPTGRFDQRWWDGQRWTRKIRHADAVATDATAAPQVRGRHRRLTGGWVGWSRPVLATIAVLLLVTVALVVAALTATWPPGS